MEHFIPNRLTWNNLFYIMKENTYEEIMKLNPSVTNGAQILCENILKPRLRKSNAGNMSATASGIA